VWDSKWFLKTNTHVFWRFWGIRLIVNPKYTYVSRSKSYSMLDSPRCDLLTTYATCKSSLFLNSLLTSWCLFTSWSGSRPSTTLFPCLNEWLCLFIALFCNFINQSANLSVFKFLLIRWRHCKKDWHQKITNWIKTSFYYRNKKGTYQKLKVFLISPRLLHVLTNIS